VLEGEREIIARGEAARSAPLQGQLAKSPSFWLKNVDIVRTSESTAS
jgi:hypothetical protein